MGRFCAHSLALASLLLASCHQVYDSFDEQVTTCRNNHLAKCAWCRCRGAYVDCQENLWDFGAGFRYGYADILSGSRGCPPAFPPRCYWGCSYHGNDGKCAIAAWFNGYHQGAAAALADGYGSDYGTVPGSAQVCQNCGARPVQIDLQQYKASMTARLGAPIIEDDFTPRPDETAPATVSPPPEDLYSPRTLAGPEETTLPEPVITPRRN